MNEAECEEAEKWRRIMRGIKNKRTRAENGKRKSGEKVRGKKGGVRRAEGEKGRG